MAYPARLFHFGQLKHLTDFITDGHISFGLAAGFARTGLTTGQTDDEMRRTANPSPKTHTVLVGDTPDPQQAQPLQNITAMKISLGIRVPYFMKCFSLGYADAMFDEVQADYCITISDVPELFRRFEAALTTQLPDWAAWAAEAQYWDFSRVPFGMNQRDLMFLKDHSKYSSQKEYRIVLLPPERFTVTGSDMRQSLRLGSLADIAQGARRPSPSAAPTPLRKTARYD